MKESCKAQISWSPENCPEIVNEFEVRPVENRVILRIECNGCSNESTHKVSIARLCDSEAVYLLAKSLIIKSCPALKRDTNAGRISDDWHPQLGRKNGKSAEKPKQPIS